MESGETPRTETGGDGPTSSVPFEVVRRAEYVFEPFLGSLIQLPESTLQRAQTTEFFLPEAPVQARASDVLVNAGAAENTAQEVGLPVPMSVVPEDASVAAQLQETNEKTTKNEEEAPRFYQPQPVRFFDPIAAATGGAEEVTVQEETARRPSIHLPEQLKAAILQIDKQLREKREEKQKAAQPKKEKQKEEATRFQAKEAKGAEIQRDLLGVEETPAKIPGQWDEIAAATDRADAERTVEASAAMAPVQGATTESVPELPQVPEKLPAAEHPASVIEEAGSTLAAKDNRLPPPAKEERTVVEATSHAYEPRSNIAKMREDIARDARTLIEIENAFRRMRLERESREIAEEREARKRNEKLPLTKRFQRWLDADSPLRAGSSRRAERMILPGLVAFYWSGGIPKPHEIVNISKTGFYLRTSDLWSVETLVRMTLERQADGPGKTRESISVLARVVRIDGDGVGHEFVTTEALMKAHSTEILPGHGTDTKDLDRFLRVW
jgi:hypothetical protein